MRKLGILSLLLLLWAVPAHAANVLVRWNHPGDPTVGGIVEPITEFNVYTCLGTCDLTASWDLEFAGDPVTTCPEGGYPHPTNPAAPLRDCGVIFPMVAGPPGVPTTWSFYMTTQTALRASVPTVIRQSTGAEGDWPLLPPAPVPTASVDIGIKKNGTLKALNRVPVDHRLVMITRKVSRRYREQE
jgi:hypothetical protein